MPDRSEDFVRRMMDGEVVGIGTIWPKPDRPHSFGWLRRPDLDLPQGEAWELPDGEIRLTLPEPTEGVGESGP